MALHDNGIELDESIVCPMKEELDGYSMENGYAVTKELLESGKEFTVIYAISDSVAIGACRAIVDAGKKVPQDYSVAGFDGLDLGTYYNPSLTTIRQPVKEMAEATIKILFDLIKKKPAENHRIFEGELIQGESVRKLN